MREASVQRIAKKLIHQKERDHSTVVLLGAGASVSAGIPVASGIIDYIKNEESFNTFIDSNSSSYFEIMSNLDPGQRTRVLGHFIKEAQINETHLIIALLFLANLVDCVLTTNFDPLVERSFNLLNLDYANFDLANNTNLTAFDIYFPNLIHLHGKYRNVLLFNTDEEIKSNKNNIRSLIDKVGTRRSWIVIGYSGKDPFFEELKTITQFHEGLYWVGFRDEEPAVQVEKGLLTDSTKNTYYISGHDSDSFFKELLNKIQNLESLVPDKFFESIKSSLRAQERIHKNIAIDLAPPNTLTKSCNQWINKKIVQGLSEEEQAEVENETVLDKILNSLSTSLERDPFQEVQELIRGKRYEKAILKINQLLRELPESTTGFYLKGVALSQKALNHNDPNHAKNFYEEMNQAFEIARQKNVDSKSNYKKLDRIDVVKKVLWAKEHNKAVDLATDDVSTQEKSNHIYERSVLHLKNAIVIQPYRPLSWNVLAQVNSMRKNYSKAAQAQEKFIEIISNPEASHYRLLSQFYRLAKQPTKAVKVLKTAFKKYPQDLTIAESLADTYFEFCKSEKAIATVEGLVKRDPLNAQYRLSLGTQLYQSALEIQKKYDVNMDKIFDLQQELRRVSAVEKQEISQHLKELEEENVKLEKEINSLSDRAITQLEAAIESRSDEPIAYNTLGIIYQNKAAAVFEKRNLTKDDKKVFELNERAEAQLKKAKTNYEKAAEIEPNNQRYWRSLSQIYTALGMDQKAKEAEKNSGVI